MKYLVFDCEIRKNPDKIGWKNFAGMGISFACAYLSGPDEYRIYGDEDINRIVVDMIEADLIVGFNILEFDMPLIRASWERVHNQKIPDEQWKALLDKCYDLRDDICEALGTKYAKGWKLDQVAQSNLAFTKNGDGALAPQLWEDGKYAELCTYVIQDVKVEKALFEYARKHGEIKNIFVEPAVLVLSQIQKYMQPVF